MAWDNARKSCEDVGGNLIKIETKEENTFLLNTFLQIPSSEVFIEAWIGLSDKDKEGTFVWTDGTPQSNSEDCTVWADDQPNDEDDQDCVEIANGVFWPGGPPQIGVWNDFQCDKELKYICEKDREEYLLEAWSCNFSLFKKIDNIHSGPDNGWYSFFFLRSN